MIEVVVALAFAAAVAVAALVRYEPAERNERLLSHKVRTAIVSFLKQKPAASITDVCKEANISWGSAQHHLYLLEQAGLVQGVRSGRSVALFAKGALPGTPQHAALLSGRGGEIARAIMTYPGVVQKDICERLDLTRKVFRHHMDQLVEAGLVEERADSKNRFYHATPALTGLLAPPHAQMPEAPQGPTGPML